MGVGIDEAGRDNEAASIDDALGFLAVAISDEDDSIATNTDIDSPGLRTGAIEDGTVAD